MINETSIESVERRMVGSFLYCRAESRIHFVDEGAIPIMESIEAEEDVSTNVCMMLIELEHLCFVDARVLRLDLPFLYERV